MRENQMRVSEAAGSAQSAARGETGRGGIQREPPSEEEAISIGKAHSFLPPDMKKEDHPDLAEEDTIEYHLKGVRELSKGMKFPEGVLRALPDLSQPTHYRPFAQDGTFSHISSCVRMIRRRLCL